MTEEIRVDLIDVHPLNPRRDATPDDELVASVRQVGVLVAVTLAPSATEEGRFTLLAGHRRIAAARLVDLDEVPALVRDDLVTEAQQVEAMLIENLHRTDLTPVEEASAYEQLQLFGMDPKAISKATGRNLATVKQRLRLRDLSESAQERLHTGDITLTDSLTLLEFTDTPEVYADLEAALGTKNFTWKVHAAREAVNRAARHAAQIEEWQAAGVHQYAGDYRAYNRDTGPFPLDWFDDPYRDQGMHPADDGGCLVYVSHGLASHQPPLLVCTHPTNHTTDTTTSGPVAGVPADAPVDTERQRQVEAAAARDALVAAERAATQARLEWLTEHFTGMLPLRGNEHLADALVVALPSLLEVDAAPLAEIPQTPRSWGEDQQLIADIVASVGAGSKPARRLDVLAQVLAGCVEVALTDEDRPHVATTAWQWLTDAGYVLSDVDVQVMERQTAPDDEGVA